ncbi:MAG TPA: substrate-binding domain-containing protein, partial [Polyangiaceae bacterium]|nr:substrate-binding domain-containing protein [Polyangiaceae bacterium]
MPSRTKAQRKPGSATVAAKASVAPRSLKPDRKRCIGVAVESVHDAWFMGLLAGIEEELAKRQTSVMLSGLKVRGKYDPSTVATWIDERRVDGIIFVCYTQSERALLDAAQAAEIPVTFICPEQTLGAGYTIRCRNFDAGRTLGEHLLALGHRRIGFAGGPKDSIDSFDRLRGLKEVVEAARCTMKAEDIGFASSYLREAGSKAAAEFLSRPTGRRPTAMVLGNDSMALAFIRELLCAGLDVPGELS